MLSIAGTDKGDTIRVVRNGTNLDVTVNGKVTPGFDLGNYSFAVGSGQRLPNGNFVFTSGFQAGGRGQSIEVRPDGTIAYVLEVGIPDYRSFRVGNLYQGVSG